MTKDEALDWIRARKEHYELDDNCQSLAEALNMAIKALEQSVVAENTTTELVGNSEELDCIDRAEAIKCLECDFDITGRANMEVVVNYINSAHDKIMNLPSVQLKTEQEPCENMERKIEKEYLFESLCEDLKKLQTENENLRNALEQEPKTGHWIVDNPVDCYLDKVRCHCSECGKKKNFPADYNHVKQEISISYKYPELIDKYCPNCGCRMSEVANDNTI